VNSLRLSRGCPKVFSRAAFTLIELLVVIAVIALLAGMLLPTLAKAKAKAQAIQCLNNHRQLLFAWRMYAEDSHEKIPYASTSGDPATDPGVWVQGWLNFDPNNTSNWDVTKDIQKSPLWPYCGNSAGIWKCPADRSTVVPASGPLRGQVAPRVRSMSMSVWAGGFGGNPPDPSDPSWRVYLRLADMVDPGPARTWILLDQRQDSINWGNFFTDMHGYPDQPGQVRFSYDFPASYHNGSGGFSFADGHAETRRWVDPRTTPPLSANQNSLFAGGVVPSPNNPDIIWMQDRSTRQVK
jgi:prepilin-type N-terminal cleavage/methylation domain-containing protein/prepilin-type processing-associated H-X9-DG protein